MKLERLIIGSFVSFCRAGTVVPTEPSNTVGIGYFPSVEDYAELYQSMGCVLESTLAKKIESDGDYCPVASGRYEWQDESWVSQNTLKMSLKCSSELIQELIWGLAAAPVDGTVQTPFRNGQPRVEGWINFTQIAQDGTQRVVGALWGQLSLDGDVKFGKDTLKPSVNFNIITSPIQTIRPENMNEAA